MEKVLTLSSLIDAGKVTDRTRLVVPGQLPSGDRVIHDWFAHGTLQLTLAGVIAQSSNIGTAQAAAAFAPGQLRSYLTKFGLGQRTNIGVHGETPGLLPVEAQWNAHDSRTGSPSASASRSTASRWLRPSTPSPTAACGSRRA